MKTPRLALLCALGVLGAAAAPGCNLGFDPSQYEPLPPAEEDAGGNNANNSSEFDAGEEDAGENSTIPRGCEDRDEDGFGIGLDCPKDQIDCDDTRAFVYPGAPEVCDGVDNDCNERVDEGEDGNPLRTECYTGDVSELGQPATACRRGFLTCTDGRYPDVSPEACTGQILPRSFGEDTGASICDGVDNDCNGDVDPQCACPVEGETRPCYDAGPAEKAGVGECAQGTQRCVRNGDLLGWGACLGAVAPGEEECDNPGEDNDCDGVTDNVTTLGESCQTSELGRCRMGRTACVDDALVCVRALEPIEETCNGVDDDCDGVQDDGVSNICGGCGALPGEEGGECGVCGDGEWTCNAELTLACVGARPLNACNGCTELPNAVGSGCGTCGTWVCDGTDSVRCQEGNQNICGGCGAIANESRLGQACGQCGTWACDPESPNTLRCDDPGLNACGGCGTLQAAPSELCGPCNDGRWACNGDRSAVVCQGASAVNACGGCNIIFNQPGDPCGAACGRYACDPANPGRLLCEEAPRNACNGCAPLSGSPGASCGTCGEWECSSAEAVTCDDPGMNACGGCAPLAGTPGAACGQCGTWTCNGTEAVSCSDPGLNACGGCGDLGGNAPGGRCGACGTWACSLDRTRLNCGNDLGFNACGGCGNVTGAAPGNACGTCGTAVCNGTNATRCEDPGQNACLSCGELEFAPGEPCDTCGYYTCDLLEGTVCDMRECPAAPAAVRLFNLIVHAQDCVLDADCPMGQVCVNAATTTGVKDSCAPDWQALLSPDLFFPYIPFTFSQNTNYFTGITRLENQLLSFWLRHEDTGSAPPRLMGPLDVSAGEEALVVMGLRRQACTTNLDCASLDPAATCSSNVCRKSCTMDSECGAGSCVAGSCAFYELHTFPEDNVPVPDMAKVRFLHFQPNHANLRVRFKVAGTNTVVHEFTTFDYGTATSFVELPPGRYDIQYLTGAGITILTYQSRILYGGEVYTWIAYGRPGSNTYWLGGAVNNRELEVTPLE